jgi:hypothetical protein
MQETAESENRVDALSNLAPLASYPRLYPLIVVALYYFSSIIINHKIKVWFYLAGTFFFFTTHVGLLVRHNITE